MSRATWVGAHAPFKCIASRARTCVLCLHGGAIFDLYTGCQVVKSSRMIIESAMRRKSQVAPLATSSALAPEKDATTAESEASDREGTYLLAH